MRRALALIATIAMAALPACSGSSTVSDRPAAVQSGPRWEDAFESMPELLAVVRPNALRKDAVYGPLMRHASELVAQKSRAAAATRPMQAIEQADEIIAGITGDGDQGESVLVLRGVRADLDPAKLADETGKPLWRPAASSPRGVAELERTEEGVPASLFVLPGRTWVIAAGPARDRVRDAFAHRSGRPPMQVDKDALLSIRIDGEALVKRIRQLRASGALSNVGKRLVSLTITLRPGSEGAFTTTFAYKDEDAAAVAEVTLKHVVDVVGTDDRAARFKWLRGARVDRDVRSVSMRVTLPRELLEELSRVQGPALTSPELPTP